ncbi:MAG: ATP-binding protein [Rubrivivax sp.]|jgi:signal transduction histidine kinase|nr:ATP-binding protein [Rubrivivax sp.]
MNAEETPSGAAGRRARWLHAFDHLNFRVKFLAVGLLVAAPLLVAATWAAVTAVGHAEQARERERSVAVMRELGALLATVGEHRDLTTRIFAGTEGLSGELVLKQQQFRAQASLVDQALAEVGESLDPSPDSPLRAEADELIKLPHAHSPERNFDRHNDLADRLLAISGRLEVRLLAGLNRHESPLAHTFGAVFVTLPQLSERIARQRGYGSWVLTQQTYTPAELHRYGHFAGHARQTLRQLLADRQTLVELDAQLTGATAQDSVKRALAQGEQFIERSQTLVLSFTRDDDVAEVHFSDGSLALKGLSSVSGALAERLSAESARLRERGMRLTAAAVVAMAMTLALISALYLAFERSTVRRLDRLQSASRRLAHGEFDRPIRVNGSDEIATLAATLDAVRRQLHDAVTQRAELMARRQAESERGDFLARWSHDLRTPLTAIIGYAQLMLDNVPASAASDQRKPLQHIHTAGQHLLQLVDDVLLASAQDGPAEARAAQLHLGAVDMAALVDDAIALVEPMARGAGVQLVAPDAAAPAWAHADRVRALQVLTNLLSNAVKFNRPKGRVTITLSASEGDVRVGIRDEGAGIPQDALHRVFQPLERLDAASRGVPGAGLGLAIAKRLTERMHGQIAVQSAPSEGCHVTWSLPAWTGGSGSPPAAPADLMPAHQTVGQDGLSGRVALIEDNEVNAQLFGAMLAPYPALELVHFASFEAAMAAPPMPGFDLWVVDRHVGIDDALEQLPRLQHHFGHMRAVMYSADTTASTHEAALRIGFQDHWVKPLPQANLVMHLRRLLQQSSAGTGSGARTHPDITPRQDSADPEPGATR